MFKIYDNYLIMTYEFSCIFKTNENYFWYFNTKIRSKYQRSKYQNSFEECLAVYHREINV